MNASGEFFTYVRKDSPYALDAIEYLEGLAADYNKLREEDGYELLKVSVHNHTKIIQMGEGVAIRCRNCGEFGWLQAGNIYDDGQCPMCGSRSK